MRQDQSTAAEILPEIVMDGFIELERPVSSQPWKGRKLLWVDDSQLLLSLYQSVFSSMGFEVLTTSSHEEALRHVSSSAADVAILDYDMPEMNGGVLASLMKERCPMLPVILYSGSPCIPPSAHHWVDAICAKAAPREELLATIERLSHKARKPPGSECRQSFMPSPSNH